ncbi:unnamed protein product [Rotaria magnacalcarata]|uniref:Uncharacterized protein n=1 Tax=Rotaria magnacalcarata TaxID=392030 RepID=A0A814N758_9BILA|nr:unnamed protein product [Rotaria magnacalcarata]CAF3887414.1 unnamed protein product [Rotaria magnacalcarata]
MDASKSNLLTSASSNDAHKTPVSSLISSNMGDNSSENTSISLNRRDGPLVQALTDKLSIVANTNASISSTSNHAHYKSSPNGNHDVEEQEQLSPLGTWGFLSSPTENEESSSVLSHSQTRSSSSNSSHESSSHKKMDHSNSQELTDKQSLLVTSNNTNEDMTKSPNAVDQEDVVFGTPRIILQKIQFDDPDLFPDDLTPDLVKRFSQENGQRSSRPRRSNNSSTASLNPSPKKKRQRDTSHEEPNYEFDDEKDDDDDDDDDDDQQSLKKRIRRVGLTNENSMSYDAMSEFKKKTRERLARKVLDIDADPHENASYKQFVNLLNIFNDDYERYYEDMKDSDEEHYLDLLLSDHTLDEMATLSEKLKLSTYMSQIEIVKLKRLLEILSLRIKQGIELSPILKHDINDEQQETQEDERAWRDLVFERLTTCANAGEVALNIMTTPNANKEILVENAIENTTLFIKAQLAKTIFPEYDPLYRSDNQSKDPLLTKQKRQKATGTKCKKVQLLYNKMISLFQGIADLVPLGKFTDTIILAISSFTVSCIYVENIFDLQAHSITILPELFSRYEHHRDSILDDILLSIVRLPTSKKSLRCYRLPSGESIQMFTALIMHLIHSPVTTLNSNVADAANELHLLNTYSLGQNFAYKFLTLFFRSCGTKQGEDDNRIIFENFLADLLVTANRPEWPASEILLTLLSRILMKNFSNQSVSIPIRLQSLGYLGSVAAQLRKDTIELDVLNSRQNQERLDQVIDKTLSSIETDEDLLGVYKTDPLRHHRSLVIYLNELSQSEPTSHTLTRRVKPPSHTELVDIDIDESLNKKRSNPTITISDEIELKKGEKITILKMLSLPITIRKQQRYTLDIDYDDVCLLMRYLTSNRPFLKTFDIYLKQLAAVFQSEAGTNIRSKAMKCLCTVVEADPTILARNDIKSCVKVGLTDKSVSVREAAIDLIGRYIVHKQLLILQYYDVLCERSIDTGKNHEIHC